MLANEAKEFYLGKKGQLRCSQCFGQHTVRASCAVSDRHTLVAGSSRPSRVRQMAFQEMSLVCLVVSLALAFYGFKTHLQICCLTNLQCQPSYR